MRAKREQPGNTKKNPPDFGVKPVQKNNKKPATNLIQLQFVVPVIINHFFTITASNDHK